jgi:hypothetical protein
MTKHVIPAAYTLRLLLLVCCSASTSVSQQAAHAGLPIDWSFHHIVHHRALDTSFEQVSRQEPRVLYNWMQATRAHEMQTEPGGSHEHRRKRERMSRADWHFTLGSGTVAPNMSPAKFTFDINATPNCANDYVVFGLNVPGSSTQPNLVAFNNVYSGAIGTSIPITSASESGTTVTIMTPPSTFATGNFVTISGVSPAGYNGTFPITVINSSQFTYTAALGLGGATTSGATAVQSGICGLNPSVAWAYNVSSVNGSILTSPALSMDGSQIAFIESAASSATFHVLKIGNTGNNGSFNSIPNQYSAAQPDNTGINNNATLLSLIYTTNGGNTRSSPYVDYSNDVAYFGDNNGNLYKTNCVFTCITNGLQLSIASGWPVALAPVGTLMASPVLDSTTGKIFVGGSNGVLYMLPLAACPGAGCAASIGGTTVGFNGPNGALIDGVLLDNTFQTLFVSAGRNGSASSAPANVVELNESLARLATLTMNANAYDIANGALDDEYFNNSVGGSAVTGNGYFCGPGAGSGQAFIFTVSFGATGALSAANPPIISSSSSLNIPGNNAAPCNPLLTFTNGATERLFFSQNGVPKASCTGASATDGCLFSYMITPSTGTIALSASTSEHGATSGIIIDNVSTLSQASSLYFASQSIATGSSSAPSCTYGLTNAAAFCAVKVTQTALQ